MKVEFPGAAGHTLAGRLELPGAAPRAWALFAHCFTCSKDVAAASRVSRALATRGFGVLRFDFTGLGSSEGDFANTDFTSNVQDLLAAAAWLRERHGPAELLVGHSLGGAAVLAAARQLDEVAAVATIGAPSDTGHVQHLFADQTADIRRDGEAEVDIGGRTFRISAQLLDDLDEHELLDGLGRLRKAVLVMHAPADRVVGIDHARRIYEALHHPKSFVSLDDADHLLSRRRDGEYVAEVLAAWASRYLPATDEPVATSLPPHQARVSEREGMRYTQRVEAGRHQLLADEPEKVGGADLGPDPYGYLLGALGACTSMTLRMYAERKKWPLEHVSVHLQHARVHADDCADCGEREGTVDRIERTITIHGAELDDEQRERLIEIAGRCPVHRTLENQPLIVTTRRDP